MTKCVHYEGCILYRQVSNVSEFPLDTIIYAGITGSRKVDNDAPFARCLLRHDCEIASTRLIMLEQSAGGKGLDMNHAASCCVIKASTRFPCSIADGEFCDEEQQVVEGLSPMQISCLIPSKRAAAKRWSG